MVIVNVRCLCSIGQVRRKPLEYNTSNSIMVQFYQEIYSLRTTTFKRLFITLKFEDDQLMQLSIAHGEGYLFLFDRSF